MKWTFPRLLFGGLLLAIAFLGVPWAIHPILNPAQGIYPSGWTHAQLIRDRYPIHLVDPEWLSDDTFWEFPESGVRLGIVVLVVLCILIWGRARFRRRP